MFNTHLKSEAKIPNGSKVVAFTRNYTKFLRLKANFTSKVKVTRFSKRLNKKKLKPKFWRFQGHFDLEDQGQGHQFSYSSEVFM